MFRFLIPTILIVLSVLGFVLFTNPMYQSISVLKEQAASYDEALNNSKALENERDKLTKKYNAINPDDLAKIKKLLPDNVDNIRLILEIEKIAMPYGMQLRDVKYDSVKKDSATTGAVQGGVIGGDQALNREYGTWSLQFSTQSTYINFIAFIKDLEKNLRIVDISSIDFSSNSTASGVTLNNNPTATDIYRFSFTIKTYWLKN